MIQYRSVAPFHPSDPNELLAELTGRLPAGVEVSHFLYHQRKDETRGLVLVRGVPGRNAVCDAIRNNPKLQLAGPLGKAQAGGKSMICFVSQPPFAPEDENQLLAELQRGLAPSVKPIIARSKREDGKIVLWIVVQGNFGKEAVKYAIYQNPNLKLLQVERPASFLWPAR